MGYERRARSYTTRSVRIRRLPTLCGSSAHADPHMLAVLGISVVLLLLGALLLTASWPPALMLGTVLMVIGAVMTAATPMGRYVTETWAGLWLALPLMAYARGWF